MSFTWNPVTSQDAVFALVPGMRESACKPLIRKISDLPRLPVSPVVSPLDFQSQIFWASRLWSRSQGLGCLIWGMNLSLFRKRLQNCEILPYCELLHRDVVFGEIVSATSTCLSAVLLSLVVERAVRPGFRTLGIIPYTAVYLLSVERGKFGVFLGCHLQAPGFLPRDWKQTIYLEFIGIHCLLPVNSLDGTNSFILNNSQSRA